jgi:uroporphyrinogen-III synthase
LNSSVVILTRSREGNEQLSSRLRQAGLSPVAIDTIKFGPPTDWFQVDDLLRRFASFDWLVLTSATGVRYFAERANLLLMRIPWDGKPMVAAVGPKTSSELARLGLEVRFVPSSYRTSTLASELPDNEGRRVLLLRADIADKALPEKLQERGFKVEAASIYSTTTPRISPPSSIDAARFIVFASPSAVRGLCAQLEGQRLEKLRSAKAVCIGPVTEAAAKEFGFSDTVTARNYTIDAVVDELLRLNRKGE